MFLFFFVYNYCKSLVNLNNMVLRIVVLDEEEEEVEVDGEWRVIEI